MLYSTSVYNSYTIRVVLVLIVVIVWGVSCQGVVWPVPHSLSPGAVSRLLSAAPILVWSAGPQTLAVSSGIPSAGVGHSGRWRHPEKKKI